MELPEFLLARIAEDEQVAQAIVGASDADYSANWALPASATVDVGDDDIFAGDQRLARHIARHDPARVLAECAAKRRIVEAYGGAVRPILCLIALPYADHPDYDGTWKP